MRGLLRNQIDLSLYEDLTELRIEYVYYSWAYEFRREIEDALERDFVTNRHLYDKDTLRRVATLLLIDPEASPEVVLKMVRGVRAAG